MNFRPEFAQQVRRQFGALGPVQHLDFPLYGNVGDALGMLTRLLVCCRDIDQLQPLVEAANGQIEQLGITAEHMTDSEYVRHLRNAVLHSHFKVFVDPQDPFQSEFVFIDVSPSGELTAKVGMTNNQLLEVIRIIIHEVLEAYLANLPSGNAWVIAP